MSTYAISDVHGHFSSFERMLDKISFGTEDELWVLGDILDKGPESAEMLVWATSAPENVHFLRGNHEDMAWDVISRDPEGLSGMRIGDRWAANGGTETIEDLLSKTDADWRYFDLMDWMSSLVPYAVIEIGHEPIALVHAGFDPYYYDLNTEEDPEHDINLLRELGWTPSSRKRITHDVGGLVGVHDETTMMWIRDSWVFSNEPCPMKAVFGHTPITETEMRRILSEVDPNASGGAGKISHVLNKHGIDCGMAEPFEATSALGCLRLNDMKEFYVSAFEK